SSSASSWSLPGIELPWSESIRSSRRSASSDETMIRGFDFVFIFQLPVRSSDYALLEHGVGDPPESGDVRPEDQVARLAELAGRLAATAIDVVHALLQAPVDLFEVPLLHAGVLAHLELAGRHPAGIGGLAPPVQDALAHEELDRGRRRGHVRALAHALATIGEQALGVGVREFVLRGAGKRHLAGEAPDGVAILGIGVDRHEFGLGKVVQVLAQRDALRLLQPLEHLEVDPVRIVQGTRRVGTGDRARPELVELLDRVDRHVAGARDQAALALDGIAPVFEHVLREVDAAIARRLATTVGAAPEQALARQDAVVAAGEALVLAEQIADLARADADVAGRDVDR